MLKCKACGYENFDLARGCIRCGKPLEGEVEPVVQSWNPPASEPAQPLPPWNVPHAPIFPPPPLEAEAASPKPSEDDEPEAPDDFVENDTHPDRTDVLWPEKQLKDVAFLLGGSSALISCFCVPVGGLVGLGFALAGIYMRDTSPHTSSRYFEFAKACLIGGVIGFVGFLMVLGKIFR